MRKIAIVEAPHADDEVFGCGGTISKLSSSGWTVYVRVWSAFDEQRMKGLLSASELLKFNTVVCSYKDTEIPVDGSSIGEAVDLYRSLSPSLVFCPYYEDSHQDHRSVSRICQSGLKKIFGCSVLMYEVASATERAFIPFDPNYFVDISGGHLDKKIEASCLYDKEVLSPPHSRSIDYFKALSTVRGAQIGAESAEGFLMVRGSLDVI